MGSRLTPAHKPKSTILQTECLVERRLRLNIYIMYILIYVQDYVSTLNKIYSAMLLKANAGAKQRTLPFVTNKLELQWVVGFQGSLT